MRTSLGQGKANISHRFRETTEEKMKIIEMLHTERSFVGFLEVTIQGQAYHGCAYVIVQYIVDFALYITKDVAENNEKKDMGAKILVVSAYLCS